MSYRDLRRALIAANGSIVALEQRTCDALMLLGTSIARGGKVSDAELSEAFAPGELASDRAAADVMAGRLAAPVFVPGAKGGRTAVVSFRGIVTYDQEYQPRSVSTKHFTRTIRELAADDTVSRIVILFDSPGGEVFGLQEASDAVYAAKQAKPVHAVCDVVCASAAYHVASQATEISALGSGWGVGSIGVRMAHMDCSKALADAGVSITHIYCGDYKIEGSWTAPLSEEARARYQFECETIYQQFLKTVARGRGVSTQDVRDSYGKGRVLMAPEAKRVGMIDRIEEPASAFKRLGLFDAAADRLPRAGAPTESVSSSNDLQESVDTSSEADTLATESINKELTTSQPVEQQVSAELELMRARLDLAAA